MTRPIVSTKISAAEAKGRFPKNLGIGRLCLSSVIVWLLVETWNSNELITKVVKPGQLGKRIQKTVQLNRIFLPFLFWDGFSKTLLYTNLCGWTYLIEWPLLATVIKAILRILKKLFIENRIKLYYRQSLCRILLK